MRTHAKELVKLTDAFIASEQKVHRATEEIREILQAALDADAAPHKDTIKKQALPQNEDLPTRFDLAANGSAASEYRIFSGDHPINYLRRAEREFTLLTQGISDIRAHMPGLHSSNIEGVRNRVDDIANTADSCVKEYIPLLDKAAQDNKLPPILKKRLEMVVRMLDKELRPVVESLQFGQALQRYRIKLTSEGNKHLQHVRHIAPLLQRLGAHIDMLRHHLPEGMRAQYEPMLEQHKDDLALMTAAAIKIATGQPLAPHIESFKDNPNSSEHAWTQRIAEGQRHGRMEAVALMRSGESLKAVKKLLDELSAMPGEHQNSVQHALKDTDVVLPVVKKEGFSKAVHEYFTACHAKPTASAGASIAG